LSALVATLPIEAKAAKKTTSEATAECNDGTLSYAKTQQRACSKRGGVKTWCGEPEALAKTTATKTAPSAASNDGVRAEDRDEGAREAYGPVFPEKQKGLLTFSKESRSVRITLTDKDLGFAACEWTVEPGVGARIRDLFRDLGQTSGSPISDIRIEGHADVMRAGQCQELKPWKDNLQLSQNRARGVLEAILDVPASESAAELDLALSSASKRLAFMNGAAARAPVRPRDVLGRRVSTAGLGSTKTLTGLAPEDARNRRVVISVTFCGGTADCPQPTEAPAREE
jgi:flagellar motor protein MotB